MSFKRWTTIGFVLLFLAAPVFGESVDPYRVLVINPFGRDLEPFSATTAEFRSSLVRELSAPVDFHEIPLDIARSGPGEEEPLVEFLSSRIKSYPIDLVVPIGGTAAQFVHRNREHLFRDTPVIVVASDVRLIPPELLEHRATSVSHDLSLPEIIKENILALRPDTSHITAVFGSSPLERFWAEECRREFAQFADRIEFTWTNNLTLGELGDHCSALPRDSFIFYALFMVDGAGVPIEKSEALRLLHKTAAAPIYGLFEAEFGLGTIGGRLLPTKEIGLESAKRAALILKGESPSKIPPIVIDMSDPRYDARELRRWNIARSDLPKGASVEFNEPRFWQQYLATILTVGSILIFQSILIGALLVNRGRRRKGEKAAALIAEISTKFVNLPADRIDHEIESAQHRLGVFLDVDVITLWQWESPEKQPVRPTHVYNRLGIAWSSIEGLSDTVESLKENAFPWYYGQMLTGRIVSFKRLEDLPDEAGMEKQFLRKFGVKSSLTIPLTSGGGLVGALGFTTLRKNREWSEVLIGRLRLIAQIFTNALARKQAAQNLRESEMRLNLTVESAEVGLFEFENGNQTLWASEKARSIFGFLPREEITMEAVRERIQPSDWIRVDEAISNAIENRKRIDLKFRVRVRGGSERWVTFQGHPEFAGNGSMKRLIGLLLDVTEQRHAEDRLDQLSHVVEQSPVLVVITDLNGEILYVNECFTRVTGYSLEDCAGKTPRILKSGLDSPKLYESLWQTVRSGKVWSGEFHNRRKDGGLYWERAIISPLINGEGKATHYVGIKEDITEQRRIMAEDAELRSTLSHASRVSVLGQLASSLAHELSQPLSAILRNAETAEIILSQPSPDWDEVRAIIDDILRDDQRASKVIDHLRSLMKRRSIESQPVDLSQVVEELLSLLDAEVKAKQVHIEKVIQADLKKVLGDRIHVQQILLNLLVNAMEAVAQCPVEQRRIKIQAKGQGKDVEVCVSDSGPGIAEDMLECLFQPFSTSKAAGMGVGLSLSRTLVEAQRGKIWAENESGGGARFHFTLPVVADAGS